MQQPQLSSFASQLRPATAPRTLAIGLFTRITQFLAPDPSSRPSDPFLHLEGRESTLDPRNEKTASSLDPPPEGREVKRASKMPLRCWYNCGTNHFKQADFCLAEMYKPTILINKSITAWSCADNQIFVGFLRIKSSEEDFKYLY